MKKVFNHTKRPEQEFNPQDAEWEYEAIEEEISESAPQQEQWEETTEGYYDEEGNWVATAGGFYDENGQWVDGYYDENGRFIYTGGFYDEEGQWVETDGYYDEEGRWVYIGGYYDETGAWIVAEGTFYADNTAPEAETVQEETEEAAAAVVAAVATGEAVQEAMTVQMDTEAIKEQARIYEEEDDEEEEEEPVIIPINRGNGFMDFVIVAASILVLVLAVVIGGIYLKGRGDDASDEFVTVGTQLQGIELVGDEGIAAIGQAEKDRINQLLAEKEKEEEENSGYIENDYNQHVSVGYSLTSVLKDLKIKFTNKTTRKLISSVPFSVEIRDEGGKVQVWQDDDRDGIIYKDSLAPGTYEVKMVALDDARYDKYTIPTLVQSVVVRKDITYTKVDVSNEIKSESEIDASKEDTKKNETETESVLPDTVTWVESTMTGNSYIEVPKSTITDPTKLTASAGFIKTALFAPKYLSVLPDVTPDTQQPSETPSVPSETPSTSAPSETPSTSVPSETPSTSVPSETPSTSAPSETPSTSAPSETPSTSAPSETPGTSESSETSSTPESTTTPESTSGSDESSSSEEESDTSETEEEELKPIGSLTLSKTDVELYVKAEENKPSVMNVTATAGGFTEGKKIIYSIESCTTDIMTVSANANTGEIGIVAKAAGKGTIVVSANYAEDGTASTKKTATINVVVKGGEKPVLTLEKTQTTVYIGADPVGTLKLKIEPKVEGAKVSFEIKDPAYFKAEWDETNSLIKLTGWAEINSSFTVKYTYEDGQEPVTATCAVTVKKHPKNDTTTALVDNSKRAIYVYENEKYRAATYADYYTASKFFVQGEPKYTGWQTLNGKLYFFTAAGDKVTGEQVIQGAKYNFASDGSLVTGSGTLGIDVSKWNGTIDWKAVKNSGVSYVIIRCGYRGSSKGALIEDPKYKENIKGATAAGLKVGVYFFTQAVNEVEAVEEASMVLDLVKNYKISYPIFLDVESSGGRADGLDKNTRTKVIKTFCETIRSAGYTPGVYANKTWLTNKMNAGELGAYKIWLAQYAATPTYSGRYDMWQYKDTGKVSGISGNVDLNISYLGY